MIHLNFFFLTNWTLLKFKKVFGKDALEGIKINSLQMGEHICKSHFQKMNI